MKLENIRIRDPFFIKEREEFYLFGSTDTNTWEGKAEGFEFYKSSDLVNFEGPFTEFEREEDFWAEENFWAPEIWKYKNRFYMVASFKKRGRCRGIQILVSESLEIPFSPIGNRPITPKDWECLDGTLYIENEEIYLIFSHEWTQIGDGEICIARMNENMTEMVEEPKVLFHASDAKWSVKHAENGNSGYVTDGPYIYDISSNCLGMIWSSFSAKGYAIGVAYSTNGIRGLWTQEEVPLYDGDGGHGMLFHDSNNQLLLAIHSPNQYGAERVKLINCSVRKDKIEISPLF